MLMAGIAWPQNPVSAYPLTVERLTSVSHPWRALLDCAPLRVSRPETRVYVPYQNHSWYYYLRQVGPWVESERPRSDELRRPLLAPGEEKLVVLFRDDYAAFTEQSAAADIQNLLSAEPRSVERMPGGVALSENVLLLTPGRFEICADAMVAAGGTRR